jgi:hypothetical protein
MAKQRKSQAFRTGMAVVSLLCLALLGGLGYYLWTYPYELGTQEAPMAASPPRISLRVSNGGEFCCAPGVWACFTFVNQGRSRLRLVDTPFLTPLYDVKLFQRASGGVLTPVPFTAWHTTLDWGTAMKNSGFDPDKDTVVELPPARALTRLIPLSQLFDLRREGQYELAVAYQPGALARSDQELAELRVFGEELQASAAFQLPLSPAVPPAQPKKP